MTYSISGQLINLETQQRQLAESINQLQTIKGNIAPLSEQVSNLKTNYPNWSMQIIWEVLGVFAEGESKSFLSDLEKTVAQFCQEFQKQKRGGKPKKQSGNSGGSSNPPPFAVGDELTTADGKSIVVERIKRYGNGWRVFDAEGNFYRSKELTLKTALVDRQHHGFMFGDRVYSRTQPFIAGIVTGFSKRDEEGVVKFLRIKKDNGNPGTIPITVAEKYQPDADSEHSEVASEDDDKDSMIVGWRKIEKNLPERDPGLWDFLEKARQVIEEVANQKLKVDRYFPKDRAIHAHLNVEGGETPVFFGPAKKQHWEHSDNLNRKGCQSEVLTIRTWGIEREFPGLREKLDILEREVGFVEPTTVESTTAAEPATAEPTTASESDRELWDFFEKVRGIVEETTKRKLIVDSSSSDERTIQAWIEDSLDGKEESSFVEVNIGPANKQKWSLSDNPERFRNQSNALTIRINPNKFPGLREKFNDLEKSEGFDGSKSNNNSKDKMFTRKQDIEKVLSEFDIELWNLFDNLCFVIKKMTDQELKVDRYFPGSRSIQAHLNVEGGNIPVHVKPAKEQIWRHSDKPHREGCQSEILTILTSHIDEEFPELREKLDVLEREVGFVEPITVESTTAAESATAEHSEENQEIPQTIQGWSIGDRVKGNYMDTGLGTIVGFNEHKRSHITGIEVKVDWDNGKKSERFWAGSLDKVNDIETESENGDDTLKSSTSTTTAEPATAESELEPAKVEDAIAESTTDIETESEDGDDTLKSSTSTTTAEPAIAESELEPAKVEDAIAEPTTVEPESLTSTKAEVTTIVSPTQEELQSRDTEFANEYRVIQAISDKLSDYSIPVQTIKLGKIDDRFVFVALPQEIVGTEQPQPWIACWLPISRHDYSREFDSKQIGELCIALGGNGEYYEEWGERGIVIFSRELAKAIRAKGKNAANALKDCAAVTNDDVQKSTGGLILSFGKCDPQTILDGTKTVTRREYDSEYVKRFIKAWVNGDTIQAYDKAPFAGGNKFADLKLTAIYEEELAKMPPSDLVHEGVDCQTVDEFAKRFFDGDKSKKVWVLRFVTVENAVNLAQQITDALNGNDSWKSDFYNFQQVAKLPQLNLPVDFCLSVWSDVENDFIGRIGFNFGDWTYSFDKGICDNLTLMKSGAHSLEKTLEVLGFSNSNKSLMESVPPPPELPDGINPGEGIKLGFKILNHDGLLDNSISNKAYSKAEWKEFCVVAGVEVEETDKIRDLKCKLADVYREACLKFSEERDKVV